MADLLSIVEIETDVINEVRTLFFYLSKDLADTQGVTSGHDRGADSRTEAVPLYYNSIIIYVPCLQNY